LRRRTYELSSSTAPDYHDAIISALADGNIDAAELAMREHIRTVRQRLLKFMEDHQPSSAAD
jgi:DNA-binding GntR family transcriptional regulator